mmetsp:Transcript_79726/g.145890  ORF Transcript_79726/g.145890 Transcript_79726/m.145890 type:complete len:308 (+) Transcript_79726:43-966(+)
MLVHITGTTILCLAGLSAGLQLMPGSRGSAEQAQKVKVEVLMEPGCHACTTLMTHSVKAAVAEAEISEMMTLDINPFGNTYFAIPKCEDFQEAAGLDPYTGMQNYSPEARTCWGKLCERGVPEKERAADCFDGQVIWQFEDYQAWSTEYFMCAKKLTNNKWKKYVPFLICFEEGEAEMRDPALMAQVAQRCADANDVDYFELETCRSNEDYVNIFLKDAARTPAHKGVPVVYINGQEQAPGQSRDSIINAVRAAAGKVYMPTDGVAALAERSLPDKALLSAAWMSKSVWKGGFQHARLHHPNITDFC